MMGTCQFSSNRNERQKRDKIQFVEKHVEGVIKDKVRRREHNTEDGMTKGERRKRMVRRPASTRNQYRYDHDS